MSTKLFPILAAVLVLLLLVSACVAPAPAPAEPAEAPAAEEAAEPAEEEEAEPPAEEEAAEEAVEEEVCVRIANYESSGEKMSMDPAILYSGGDAPYVYAVYERLVDVTPNFEVVPELAESWESNEDATEWTFHLREGVKFHDGSDFDAADVVYTYQRILDPELGSSGYAILSPLLTPEGIVAADEHTVVFKTEESAVTLPMILTTKETGIVPEGAAAEDLRLHGVGTGPYMYDTFTPGNDYVKLVANPDYWQDGLPNAPCLEIRTIQEATTAAAALQGGDLDVVLQVDSAVLPSLQNDANVNLLETAAGNSMTLSMFSDEPPFDDINVRTALKKVIDRDQMVQTVLLGYGEPGADNPIPITDPMSYLHGQEVMAQDIEGAKALLAEAGYDESNPLVIDLYTSEAIPGHTRMSQVFAEQAAEAGVQVNVIQTPPDTFWDDVWLTQSFVTSAWSRRPVIVAEGMAYTCSSQYPETHWCRPEFDELMAKAASTLDEAERTEYLHAMQQMIAEDGGVIIPMFVHAVAGVRAECDGWEPHVQNFNNDWSQIGCER